MEITEQQNAYTDVWRQRPFGWTFDDPPTFESFSFERIDPFFWHKTISENWKLCYYIGALYIVTIFGLREYMKKRRAINLTRALFFWNLGLGFFSTIGFLRTAPELLHVLTLPNGLYNSICVKTGANIPTLYWSIMFALSKYLELGDTVFIVLRKRPLEFLQWYHHLVTVWNVWTVAPLVEPIGRWYIVLNYGVHSLMYTYFAFKTICIKMPSIVANCITTFQFLQMVIGFAVNVASVYMKQSGYECVRYPSSIKAFGIIYGSFIILFGHLLYKSAIINIKKRRTNKGS